MTGGFLHFLEDRGVILVKGKDRFDFLQGLITQDIFLLKTQIAIYTAMLSPQGRYLYDFFVLAIQEDFLIISSRPQELLKRLSIYKLRRDVTLSLANFHVYAGYKYLLKKDDFDHVFEDPRGNTGVVWGLCEKIISPTENTYTAYHLHRIIHNLPENNDDPNICDLIVDKTFPLEAGLHNLNAISFTKGCYVGQELTTRTHHRGVVRKKLLPVIIEGDATSFQSITQNDEEVGELRSRIFYDGKTMATALLRLEALENQDPLLCNNFVVSVQSIA